MDTPQIIDVLDEAYRRFPSSTEDRDLHQVNAELRLGFIEAGTYLATWPTDQRRADKLAMALFPGTMNPRKDYVTFCRRYGAVQAASWFRQQG